MGHSRALQSREVKSPEKGEHEGHKGNTRGHGDFAAIMLGHAYLPFRSASAFCRTSADDYHLVCLLSCSGTSIGADAASAASTDADARSAQPWIRYGYG